jgi:hypothetical protein
MRLTENPKNQKGVITMSSFRLLPSIEEVFANPAAAYKTVFFQLLTIDP